MLRYVVHRLLVLIPLMIGLSVVVFLYVHMMPGDPVQAMAGPDARPELVAEIRRDLGLDRPVHVQFWDWVTGLPRGDLGITFRTRQPIGPILVKRIPATLQLAGGSLLVAVALGLPPGILAGLKKDTKLDYVFSLFALAGLSTPLFWSGYLLMLLFAVKWGVLPAVGYVPSSQSLRQNLTYLVMPAFTLGLGMAPYIAKMTRTAVVETMQEVFVYFGRAKGLPSKRIIWRYVFRHAMLPIIVVLGMDMGYLLGGQIVVEELFNWPGTGRLMVRAVLERDYFMVQATVLIYATIFILINFAAELLHGWLDPRIRFD